MKKIKVLSVFGTRPEAIKMAPLALELKRRAGIDSTVCVTGQHSQMLDSAMQCFGLKADFDLNIPHENAQLSEFTAKAISGVSECIKSVKPDLVLVHGDTSTALAAALAAFYEKVPVGHVEAGMRTDRLDSPYPEEGNRRCIAQLAALNFAPIEANAENLRREAAMGRIFVTGNTVIDALAYTSAGDSFSCDRLNTLDFSKRIIVFTCHRRENYGKAMQSIFSAVRELAEQNPDVVFVYPVHPAPEVQTAAHTQLNKIENVILTEALDAADMHRLMRLSYMVMTDSGGLQEEAPALGKPVLVLRTKTERPEAIKAGTAVLCGVEKDSIVKTAQCLLDDSEEYERMAKAVNPYGDGKACLRIADAIEYCFGIRDNPPDSYK